MSTTLPSAAPTTQPLEEEIPALIAQLGDADSHVRNHASKRLEEIGAPAMPALKAACDSKDLEVKMRARQLASDIERPPVPNPPSPGSAATGAKRVRSIRMASGNGSRVIDVNDNGRTIHIEETGQSIVMTVVGEINGKPAMRTYQAKDASALEKQNAEAFALYTQWADRLHQVVAPGGNVVLRFQQGGAIAIGPNVVQPAPAAIAPIPAQGRLGVQLSPEPVADGGVIVANVLPNTRAAAIGVQPQDVILKLNDQPIVDADGLRAELLKHPTGLALEVKRDGKVMTLKE